MAKRFKFRVVYGLRPLMYRGAGARSPDPRPRARAVGEKCEWHTYG